MPSTERTGPVLLAVLVVFAGCSMAPNMQSAEPRTASQEPPSDTPQAEYPPGVTNSSLENASKLLATHLTVLRNTGYRLTEVRGDTKRTLVATSTYSSYRIIPGASSARPAVWANETVTLARMTRQNRTVYQRPPRLWASPAHMTGTQTLRVLFNTSQYTVHGTQRCGSQQYTILTATGSSRFENFTARALIAPSGVIHEFHATFTQTDQRQPTTTEYHLTLTQLGNVTVSRPPWIDTAIANT